MLSIIFWSFERPRFWKTGRNNRLDGRIYIISGQEKEPCTVGFTKDIVMTTNICQNYSASVGSIFVHKTRVNRFFFQFLELTSTVNRNFLRKLTQTIISIIQHVGYKRKRKKENETRNWKTRNFKSIKIAGKKKHEIVPFKACSFKWLLNENQAFCDLWVLFFAVSFLISFKSF